MPPSPAAFEVTQLFKSFGATKALRGIDIVIGAGEVHGLAGGNGAGKSTLLKLFTGVYKPDAGSIRLLGERYEPRSPFDARKAGVALIPQELRTVPGMTVTDNVMLGRWPVHKVQSWLQLPMVDRAAAERIATAQLRDLGLEIDPAAKMRDLSFAERQSVVIARAISSRAKVLIFDEPTAALAQHEVEKLSGLITRLRQQGVTIIYVSHRLEELETLCDRVTALRDGQIVAAFARGTFGREQLIAAITGTAIHARKPRPPKAGPLTPLLEVEGPKGRGATLRLHAGQVSGLHGLRGSGIGALLQSLFGAGEGRALNLSRPAVTLASPRDAIDAGLGYVPDERFRGIVPALSVRDNILLPHLDRYSRFGRLNGRAMDQAIAYLMSALDIRPRDPGRPARSLSGGNQQKILFARWLAGAARTLLLDEPAHGIDVGAKAMLEDKIAGFAAAGGAVLMHSSELDDLIAIADDIRIMTAGELSAPVPRGDAGFDRLTLRAMT